MSRKKKKKKGKTSRDGCFSHRWLIVFGKFVVVVVVVGRFRLWSYWKRREKGKKGSEFLHISDERDAVVPLDGCPPAVWRHCQPTNRIWFTIRIYRRSDTRETRPYRRRGGLEHSLENTYNYVCVRMHFLSHVHLWLVWTRKLAVGM